KSVLFSSQRNTHTARYSQLFTVPLTGGMPTQLPIPWAAEACYSPDGEFIAYNPNRDVTGIWKHYRRGTHRRLWVYNVKTHEVTEIPQPKDRCNDLDPNWVGNTVYFRSDRAGEYNVFAYDTGTREVKQVTKFTDFPVLDINAGGGRLIFEQAGYLHLLKPGESQSQRLKVGVAAELTEAPPRYAQGTKQLRSAAISPSGARTALGVRREIRTVPAEKGAPRNLTRPPGTHERFPAWSPDGAKIAYFSDAGGEYQLHVRTADGNGEAKTYQLGGAGHYERPVFSPDGKKI